MDGYIAGPNDDLRWLGILPTEPARTDRVLEFAQFLSQIGVIVMGRRTFDRVQHFEPWPYGDIPVWVLTHRPLSAGRDTVCGVAGEISEICCQAQQAAGEADVYLDGGHVVSAAVAAGCVDELIVTQIPVFLGNGILLYTENASQRWHSDALGGLGEAWQLRCTPVPMPGPDCR